MRKFMYILIAAALGASMTACGVNGTESMDGGIKNPGNILSSDTSSEANIFDSTVSVEHILQYIARTTK